MTPAELKEKGKKTALKIGEVAAKTVVDDLFDDAILVGKEAVKANLPDVGDAIVDMVVSALQAPAKAALLASIDKISEEV